MKTERVSEGRNDLAEQLKHLETFFPVLRTKSKREVLEEEVQELETHRRLGRAAQRTFNAYPGVRADRARPQSQYAG